MLPIRPLARSHHDPSSTPLGRDPNRDPNRDPKRDLRHPNRSRSLRTSALAAAAVVALGAAVPVAAQAPARTQADTRAFSVAGDLTGTLTLTTDYRFRGVSRTFRDPALQGSLDFMLPSNFYIGTWASTVDKEIFANTRGLEVDVYGGYRWDLGNRLELDVGLIQYMFPTESRFSTLEAYADLGWQWLSFKVSRTLSNRYFGAEDARGSHYYDLTAIYPLGRGVNVIGHYGVTRIDSGDGNYTDVRLGVTKDWQGFTWGASVYDTDRSVDFTNRAGRTKDLGDRTFVLSVSKTF